MTMDLRFYLSLFTRRLPWFLLLLTLGTVVGVTLARVLPPVYIAEALLVVESEQIPDELAAFYAAKVNSDAYLPPNMISAAMCGLMLSHGLVTPERLRMRGVR